MKCINCGARIKKSEETCPNCGAYITKNRADFSESTDEVTEKEQEILTNTDDTDTEKFNYKDYLVLPSVFRIVGGIALFVLCIFTFDSKRYFIKRSLLVSHIFALLASVFLIFRGISGIIQERKCKLTMTSDRIYGIIPFGILDTEEIDINIRDIISVRETGFATRYSSPEIHILTAEKEITLKGSSEKMLRRFSKSLYKKIKSLKENENED